MEEDKKVAVLKQEALDEEIPDPNKRLKALSEFGDSIEIDSNIPPRRWG